MKKIILLTFLFFNTFLFSQNETVKIITAITEASMQEAASLVLISDKQKKVHKYVKKITTQSASIVVLKKKHLEALKKVDPILKELNLYKEISELSKQIYEYNKKAYDYGKENPLIITYVSDIQVSIIEDVVYLLDDIRLAFKGGEKNLLDTVDRMEIMEMIKKELIELRNISKNHYQGVRLLVSSNKFIDRKELFSINFKKIEEIVKNEYERLKEELEE